jgi:divalent metal cation (Fe/Co/Zn/Cd) transporter
MKLENTSFYQLPVIGKVSEAKLVSSIAALLIVFGYFFTRNWLLSNAIAISITLFMFKVLWKKFINS